MSQDILGLVLLVDGNSAQRRFYSDILSVHGYAVYPAANFKEVEQFLLGDSPTIILLDVTLKETDGIESCVRLRQKLGDQVPILFFAAADTKDIVLAALRAGGDDYIVKSGSSTILLERIAYWRDADMTDVADRRAKAIAYLETHIEQAAEARRRRDETEASQPDPVARRF